MDPFDEGYSTTYRVNVAGTAQDATININHAQYSHGDWIYLGNFDIGPMTSSRQYVGLLGDSNSDGSEGTFLEADAVKLVPTFAPGGYFSIRYIHSDHLGTPQFVTDDAGQVIWSARYQPFGEATIHEDPDGDLENYDLNIRFPGQYFDSESGLHYNYFRDYEPSVGRYIESDPIGLLGGTNTYLYARGNPLIWIDPTGRESKIACQIRCSLTKRILICPPFVVAGAGLGAGLGAAVGGLGTGPAAIAGAVIGQRVGASLGARAGGVVCSLLVQTICEKECTPKTCEG